MENKVTGVDVCFFLTVLDTGNTSSLLATPSVLTKVEQTNVVVVGGGTEL